MWKPRLVDWGENLPNGCLPIGTFIQRKWSRLKIGGIVDQCWLSGTTHPSPPSDRKRKGMLGNGIHLSVFHFYLSVSWLGRKPLTLGFINLRLHTKFYFEEHKPAFLVLLLPTGYCVGNPAGDRACLREDRCLPNQVILI